MAYRVTKIVYASHPNTLQAGGVPHQQTLLIFGSEGIGADVLLWQGYRTPLYPSEWEGSTSGGVTTKSWGGSFTQGYGATSPDQLKNLSPVDTSTPSVSANISYASNSPLGYVLTFTYAAPGSEEAEEYTVYLGNYVNSEIRMCTPRKVGETTIYQTYDFVPAEVGISNDGSAESSAEYGTTASYRRAVVNEWVVLESFDVQLTGPKQFTATYSGRCYLDDNVHSSFNAVSFRLYATELDANGDAVETGSYGLPVTASNGNTEFSGSLVLTDIANQIDYDLATKYKFYVVASIDAEEAATSAEIQRWTQRKLPAPSVSGWQAQDGAGYVSWGAVENAAGYEIAVVDSATATPVSGTSAASPWNFNETNGTAVQDRYVRLMSVAVSNQYEYANSEWSAGVLITGTRTPEEEEPSTPVEINMARLPFKAIPRIDVPVEQIGAGGSSPKDVITVEYADEHYVKSSGEIPASQIPFAVYGDTDDDSETTVVNPAYVKGAIGDINQVYAITDIQIASDNNTKFAGITTVSSGEDYYLVTNKAMQAYASNASNLSSGTVNNARLKKAKSSGGVDNAGIVYISNAQGQNGLGLKIDTSNEGLLSVNFATYGTDAATVTTKAVHPKYVADAISALSLGTAATKDTGTSSGNVPILDSNGKLATSVIPDLAITDITTKTDKVRYGTGQTYTDRAAAIAAKLPTTGIQKGDVYIYAPSLSDAEQKEGGYLVGTFIYTGSAWQEMYTPVDGVITVNGKYGPNVTLSASDVSAIPSSYLETTLTTTSDVKVPSSKAVATYVTGRGYQTASQVSTAISDAVATSVANGVTGYTTGDQVYDYVTGAINGLELGAAAKKGVASTIAANTTDLPTGSAVYSFVTGLDYSDFGAAAETHYHGIGDITYSGSGNSRVGYSAGTTISTTKTSNNDGQLATTLAVYNFVSTNYAAKTHTHTSADVTDSISTAAGITNSATGLVQGKAVYLYVSGLGLGDASKKGVATSITSTETGLTPGSVVFNYAAPKTHSHTSSQISDAISAFTSGASGQGKAVKTLASGTKAGYVSPDLIPIDEYSIAIDNGVLAVPTSFIQEIVEGYSYLTTSNASATYLKRETSGVDSWVSSNNYAVGDTVFYQGKLYRCKTANSDSSFVYQGVAARWEEITILDLIPAGRYTGTITGDGTTTEFTVTHGLGVKDVDVTLIDNNTDQEVFAAVAMYSATQVKIGFGAAPESGKAYRVVVRK